MSTPLVLAAAALGGSLFLIGTPKARAFAIGAAVVSGLRVIIALGIIRLSFAHMDLVFAVALAVLGVLLILRVDAKAKVIAATVIAAIGTLQALTLLF